MNDDPPRGNRKYHNLIGYTNTSDAPGYVDTHERACRDFDLNGGVDSECTHPQRFFELKSFVAHRALSNAMDYRSEPYETQILRGILEKAMNTAKSSPVVVALLQVSPLAKAHVLADEVIG